MRIVATIPHQGGPRITENPFFFEKRKKSSKTQKLKNVQRYANSSDMPFDQRSLIHREAWFPPCFVRQNQPKKTIFFVWRFQTTSKLKCSNVRPLLSNNFPQGFQISKIFGFLAILGPPYCGIRATIRIGREMLCLPYAGFLL